MVDELRTLVPSKNRQLQRCPGIPQRDKSSLKLPLARPLFCARKLSSLKHLRFSRLRVINHYDSTTFCCWGGWKDPKIYTHTLSRTYCTLNP